MEIMIQTKRHMFSFGTKGYRKVTTHDWGDAKFTFEVLMQSQTGKLAKKTDELNKASKDLIRAAKGPAPTWDEGAWDDSHPDVVTGLGQDYPEPAGDWDFWKQENQK